MAHINSVVGVVLLAATLIRELFRTGPLKNGTWFNVVVSWMIYALAYTFIDHNSVSSPSLVEVCYFQSSVVYSVPALAAMATAAYLISACVDICGSYPVQMHDIKRWMNMSCWAIFSCSLMVSSLYVKGSDSVVQVDSSGKLMCTPYNGVPLYILVLLLLGPIAHFCLTDAWLTMNDKEIEWSTFGVSSMARLAFGLLNTFGALGLAIYSFGIDVKPYGLTWEGLYTSLPALVGLIFLFDKPSVPTQAVITDSEAFAEKI